MKIAICDDDPRIIEEIKELIGQWAAKNRLSDVGVEAFSSAEGLLLTIEDTPGFDTYLLDLELPKMNGFRLAQKIRETDPSVPIVFVTNSDDYLLRGYELEICRYIKKPLKASGIFSALDRCREKFEQVRDTTFVVNINGSSVKLDYAHVLYIMAGGHSIIYTLENRAPVRQPIYTNLDDFASKLPESFLRCHRGYIVNLHRVYSYNAVRILLTDGEEIPIGRAYRDSSVSALQDWFLSHVLI